MFSETLLYSMGRPHSSRTVVSASGEVCDSPPPGWVSVPPFFPPLQAERAIVQVSKVAMSSSIEIIFFIIRFLLFLMEPLN